jgi:hypothetical protein
MESFISATCFNVCQKTPFATIIANILSTYKLLSADDEMAIFGEIQFPEMDGRWDHSTGVMENIR